MLRLFDEADGRGRPDVGGAARGVCVDRVCELRAARWILRTAPAAAAILAALQMGGCALAPTYGTGGFRHFSDRECLARVMYFESNRSSDEGMLAVGTVVMNRVASRAFPSSVCGVVGQRGQFASGVLHKPMSGTGRARAERVADAVLGGERDPRVAGAMFFHTAGLHFPYHNMHYVLVAGGNAFYEKTSASHLPDTVTALVDVPPSPLSDRDRLALFLTNGEGL
jgi:Cell Wall Hydrolase